MTKPPGRVVYDKAKYHHETVASFDLPEAHASHHTLYFLRWLIDNDLMGEEFLAEAEPLEEYRAENRSLLSLYEWWDCCLVDDMLSVEGNEFAKHYFDFERGQYIGDYIGLLQDSLPSEFHIEYTDQSYERLKCVIDQRYHEWKKPKRRWWWPFGVT